MTFDCPRCGTATDHEYYGPCATCRDDLRAAQGPAAADQNRAASDTEASRFEPALHVTPNAVALRDD